MLEDFSDGKSNIGSGDGLVPPGNKPLPDSMLTQMYVTLLRHLTQWVTCETHINISQI